MRQLPHELIKLLACPQCLAPVAQHGPRVACVCGHSFDIARQGYVSMLLAGAATTGDTPAMVAARERLTSSGVYDSIVASIVDTLIDVQADMHENNASGHEAGHVLLDSGGATGHLASELVRRRLVDSGIVLDLSRPAIQRAARANNAVLAVRADTWQTWPVTSRSIDLATHVFAPRNPTELHRVLRPSGIAVVVTPQPQHLHEIVEQFALIAVDPVKDARLAAALADGFIQLATKQRATTLRLSRDQVADLVVAGPTGAHLADGELDEDRRELLLQLPEPFAATAAWNVQIFTPRPL